MSAPHLMPENHQINLKSLKLYKQAPAPWKLKGEGIILIYKFSKSWIETHGKLPEHLKGKFQGGLGFVMVLDYQSSPVGPYRELLFIPGTFAPYGKQAITKIYVNTEVSTHNGHMNWGIPKETLPILMDKNGGTELIQVSDGACLPFSCEVSVGKIPFPFSTSFLPFDFHQLWNGVDFFFKPSAYGWCKYATIKNVSIDSAYFPDISSQKPLFAIITNSLRINFPASSYAI